MSTETLPWESISAFPPGIDFVGDGTFRPEPHRRQPVPGYPEVLPGARDSDWATEWMSEAVQLPAGSLKSQRLAKYPTRLQGSLDSDWAAEWMKGAGSCCGSCAEGGECEGGGSKGCGCGGPGGCDCKDETPVLSGAGSFQHLQEPGCPGGPGWDPNACTSGRPVKPQDPDRLGEIVDEIGSEIGGVFESWRWATSPLEEKRCGPDVTDWFAKTLYEHHMDDRKKTTVWALVSDVLLAMPGGEADAKRQATVPGCPEGGVPCDETVTLCGVCVSDQIPGNISLGFSNMYAVITALVSEVDARLLDGRSDDPEAYASIHIGKRLRDWLKRGTKLESISGGAHTPVGAAPIMTFTYPTQAAFKKFVCTQIRLMVFIRRFGDVSDECALCEQKWAR